MATSMIKDRNIHYVDYDLAGVQVTNADGGWYYAEVSLPNTPLPNRTLAIGLAKVGSWDAPVFFSLYANAKIIITSPSSRTLGNNRFVRIFYQYY